LQHSKITSATFENNICNIENNIRNIWKQQMQHREQPATLRTTSSTLKSTFATFFTALGTHTKYTCNMREPVGAHRDAVTFNSLISELGLFRRWLPALSVLRYMVLEGHLLRDGNGAGSGRVEHTHARPDMGRG
jgi:hypothetical protein